MSRKEYMLKNPLKIKEIAAAAFCFAATFLRSLFVCRCRDGRAASQSLARRAPARVWTFQLELAAFFRSLRFATVFFFFSILVSPARARSHLLTQDSSRKILSPRVCKPDDLCFFAAPSSWRFRSVFSLV